MDLMDKIKQNENTPIYIALLIGFLIGMLFGILLSPVMKGLNINTRIAIGSHNGCNNAYSDSCNTNKPLKHPHFDRCGELCR